MYKYNPKNMISVFLPKYYFFFVQKFTKTFLYIYNQILRKAPDSIQQNRRILHFAVITQIRDNLLIKYAGFVFFKKECGWTGGGIIFSIFWSQMCKKIH